MDRETKTFENDDFLVEAQEEPGCILAAKVVVKPKSAQKAHQKAVKIVNKQISVPGFRKGHAPDKTVITRYGSYVEQEWKEIIAQEAYRAALDLSQIYPLNKEGIQRPKIESCSEEDGAVMRIAYECYPTVPTIDFSQIKIPTFEVENISDTQIDGVVEEIQRAQADWEDVVDRAVQEGDFADVSLDAIDTDPPKPIVTDRRFEITDKRLPPWLKNLLLGLQIGESVEGTSELDEAADEKIKKNFKPTQVRATLHAIKKIVLPEVNDALAQKSGASSVEDLRDKISQKLEKEREEERELKKAEALEQALLDTYSFDLPASVTESEREGRISKRIQELKNEQVPESEIKAKESEIEQEVADEVDRSLRLYFLNKQIARQGKISLTNQELNEALMQHLQQYPGLYGKQKDEAFMRDLVSRMADALMQRKVRAYSLSQLTY